MNQSVNQPVTPSPVKPIALAKLMLCLPFYIMLGLMLIEALLSATTTYLVIQAGRDVMKDGLFVQDLLMILGVQSSAYIAGAISWIFAERAGFLAYGRYMLRLSLIHISEPTRPY